MSANFQLEWRCPHCSELKDFVLGQFSEIVVRDRDIRAKPLWDHQGHGTQYKRVEAAHEAQGCGLSRCPNCGNPVMFVVRTTVAQMRAVIGLGSKEAFGAYARAISDFEVVTTYPAAPRIDAHPAWPEVLRKPFVEMQEDARRGRTPAFIITGCRSILDVATKDLGGAGKSIFDRIEDLKSKGLLTGALADWAHALRKRGADAVHDLQGDAETARQLVEFIKLFLHVAYELPEAIRERRPEEDPI